jgi:predicted GNAT family N-acyltransferase
LALFEQNCPHFFAPNERAEFAAYLQQQGHEYLVYELAGQIISAFGLHLEAAAHTARINWMMAAKNQHNSGIGRMMMREAVLRTASDPTLRVIHISASQHSAPFFTRFGAWQMSVHPHGWGPEMHRIEMELPLHSTQAD